MNKERALSDFYYDTKNPSSYAGPLVLYRALQDADLGYTYSLSYVKRWLNDQDSYSRHKPVRHRFKTAKVRSGGLNDQFDIDLADVQNLSKYNDGIRYLLFSIDVFSRYLRVVPLKDKTAKSILQALKLIFSQITPSKVRSDKGSEFNNRYVRAYLRKCKIKYFTTNNPPKANYAERVQRTIKDRLYRYFSKARSYRFIDDLANIVNSYNNTKHRSLNYVSPANVTQENQADLWSYLYLRKKKGEKTPAKPRFKYKVGQLVRLAYTRYVFRRSYQEHWTSEIFKIKSRFLEQNIPLYKLRDFHDKPIVGNFYESELSAVSKSEDALWIIEEKIRKRRRRGVIEWLVKFEGWPNSFNQWVKESDIQDVSSEK